MEKSVTVASSGSSWLACNTRKTVFSSELSARVPYVIRGELLRGGELLVLQFSYKLVGCFISPQPIKASHNLKY